MPQHTPLHQQHLDAGGKVVDFAGWALPINYGSQVDEHHAVRRHAGMFDVSHMAHTSVEGVGATAFLRRLLGNDVAKLDTEGHALYSCMLNPDGGVLDDLIAYRFGDNRYRVISNAATRESDAAWMVQVAADFDVALAPRGALAMLAVQGPEAIDKAVAALPSDVGRQAAALDRFQAVEHGDVFVGRTGYTGEDGFEVAVPAADAGALWQALLAQGVSPAGLGARDTLRLEAGMALYGNDLDDGVTPLESRLGWTVDWSDPDRDFIGRAPLERQRADGVARQLVGLVLDGRGVLRGHQDVYDGDRHIGQITSGGFSPTTARSVALARVAHPCKNTLNVDIRGRHVPVTVVPFPFVRNGQSTLPSNEESGT
ncbi:MAG: glycine cleavage system aminomethyltransferase GcvT [Pseudomonadota bacterium]